MTTDVTSAPAQSSEPPSNPPPDRTVVVIGVVAVLSVVLWAALDKGSFSDATGTALNWVLENFSWLFMIAANVFLVLCIVLALGRYGRIRLGKDDAEPEFTGLAWIAMMFSAGMGIGLMFYGVGEPLQHFAEAPPFGGPKSGTENAARVALEYSFFHWTLHPWAIFGISGLALAYVTFRKERGNRISSVFVPLFGQRRADGWQGKAVDLLAVFATVFGTATSLGLGALQIAGGLNETVGLNASTSLELLIIVVLGAAFVFSAMSGLHRGVKWLSSINLVLAACLMLFVFVVGPSVYILNSIPATVGPYLQELLITSTRTGAFGQQRWLGAWTIFYWAWWLSWAPFVGTFLARISHGRTVREFLLAVLLIPSGASAVWFCVMGGTAIRLDQNGDADLAAHADDAEKSLFSMLDALPLSWLTTVVAILLVVMYFITSADSASLVMGSLTSRGALHPPTWLVVTWGVLMSAVAAVLLVAGGLDSLKSGTILVALPFVFVMLALCWALLKELRQDPGAGMPRQQQSVHGLRDAVRRMVGDAMVQQDQETGERVRHRRLRRAAESRRTDGDS